MRVRPRALVIGSGAAAQRVASLARRHRESGIEVVGLLDDDGPPQPAGGPPVLGGLADLEQVLDDHAIDRVIVAFTRSGDADLVGVVRRCDHRDVSVAVVPRLFEVIKPVGTLLGGLPLADATSARDDATTLALKRAIDIVGAAVGLILTAPLLAVTGGRRLAGRAGAGAVPAGADRQGRPAVPGAQVPDDARRAGRARRTDTRADRRARRGAEGARRRRHPARQMAAA